MKTIGSQTRATLKEEGLNLLSIRPDGQQIATIDKDGKISFWQRNNDFAGFVIVLFGIGYEFVSSI